MTAFQDLANLPFGDVHLAVELQAYDPVADEQRFFYLTNAPSLYTQETDTPPNQHFSSVLMPGWRTERRLTERATFTGASVINSGELLVANHLPDGSPAPLDDWESLQWNNQPISIKAGGATKADGTAFPFGDYEEYFTGVVEDVVPRADGLLAVVIAGRTILCQQKAVETFYKGLGGGLLVEAKSNSALAEVTDASLGITGDLTVEWIGYVRALPSGPAGALVRNGFANDLNYGLGITSDGSLWLQIGAASTPTRVTLPAGTIVVDEFVHVVGSCDAAGNAVVYKGTGAEDIAAIGTNALSGGPLPKGGPVEFGRLSATGLADVEVLECRVWHTVRTLEQIRETADAPLVDPDSNADITSCWKFNDGTGNAALSEITEDQDLALTNPVWVSSYEGDDPEQFEGDLLGNSKPRLWGSGFNVPVVGVDQQRHDGQWSDSASADLLRLKVNGAPMVPDETLTSTSLGELSFDTTFDKVVIAGGSPLSFHRFIAGQADPEVLGQRITISNSTSWDGTYRVAKAGINKAANKMRITNEDGTLVSLSSGDMPSGTVIETTTEDIQYTYDLTNSTVRTAKTPPGQLTADAVGLLTATAKVSEIFENIVGETVNNDLTFDPVVSIHVAAGETPTKCELLDRLAQSALGWWIEERTGGYRLGNYAKPSGVPVAHLMGSRIHEISEVEDWSLLGQIISIEPLPLVVPSWQTRCGYGRSWFVHDSVAGSLPLALRRRLTEPFRTAIRTYPTVRTAWPTSEPLPVVETLITNRTDAEQWLDLAKDLFTERRRWFRVQLSGLGLLSVELGNVVYLQHPDRTFGLTTGQLAVIAGMIEDTSSSVIELEVYT